MSDLDLGDAIETAFMALLLGAYAYSVLVHDYRLDDPFLETMLFTAAGSLFGHKFLEYKDSSAAN